MTFVDVLLDIEKLKGKRLQSIKRGAEITIHEVDRSNDRILLTTINGRTKTRPISELRILWDNLCTNPAIHVDSTLAGSGGSRNQPETILANLPYVEWLNYQNKKHISLVRRPTHELATLKCMDDVAAEEVKKQLEEGVATQSTVVVIASDVRQAALSFEDVTGLKPEALQSGIYKQDHSGSRVFIVAHNSLRSDIKPGTYAVIRGTSIPPGSSPIKLADQTLYPIANSGMNIMVLVPES